MSQIRPIRSAPGPEQLNLRLSGLLLTALLLAPTTVPAAPAPAKGTTLRDLAGKPVAVADLHRKGPAILWFTNLCDNCQGGFAGLDRVLKAAKPGTTVTGISFVANDRDRVAAIMKVREPSFPVLLDPDGAVTKRFTGLRPIQACPLINLILLDRKGKVVYRGHYPGVTPGELIRRLGRIPAQR